MSSTSDAAAVLDGTVIDPHMTMDEMEQKSVLIVYTGGTMGMKPDENGSLAPVPGYLVQVLNEMPEMHRPEMPKYDIIEYDPLIDSSSMGPDEWVKIATDIQTHYLAYDGFVVCMGTDTMGYAASALSFMLENLGKPVIFTGSLIPQYEVYSDARRNLLVSIIYAMSCDIPEVCICFNDNLMRGNRTKKINSVGMAAFESPNYPQLAVLGTVIRYRHHLALKPPRSSLRVHKKLCGDAVVIKLAPGFNDEVLFSMVRHTEKKFLKALVLELYGTGNGPSNKQGLLDAISCAQDKGIMVVGVSQCVKGSVSLDSYALGREFMRRGVIPCEDMTTEACVTKIAYLLGRGNNDVEYVRKFLTIDLRGELTPREKAGSKFFDITKNETKSRLSSRL